jgi:hypothetical protein
MPEVINIIGLGVTDPHIRIHGDRAYLFASRDFSKENTSFVMREWQVWSSDDLLNWQLESTLKPENTHIGKPFDGCWATDAVEKDGKWYWCFSEVDESKNLHRIGIVAGTSPAGPWKDVLGKPLLESSIADTKVYDPCLFKDEDGSVYLFFGVWDYYFVKMGSDMLSSEGVPRRIRIIDPRGPYGIGKTDDKIFVHKRRGIYYLSWGSYYATATRIEGPYTYRGCIVDPEKMESRFLGSTWPKGPSQGRHGSFFEWNNQWFFTYCEMCFSGNRYYRDFWISYVHYREDGGMEPININSQAVGTYDAEAGRIAGGNFFKGVGTQVTQNGSGEYGVLLQGKGSKASYPNVRKAGGYQMLTLSVAADGVDGDLILEAGNSNARELARINLDWMQGAESKVVNLQLKEPLADTQDISIRLEGGAGSRANIDWFQLSE